MTYKAEDLRKFSERVMVKAGLSEEESCIFSDSLLKAEMRGVSSHGLTRLSTYAKRVEMGLVNAGAKVEIISDAKSLLRLDGNNGMGTCIGTQAMQLCIARAKEYGNCFASVCGGNHFGYAAFYAEQAAKENMIGLTIANAPTAIAPIGGVKALLGTNPVAVCIPAGRYRPLVMDMATSAVARGKVALAQKNGDKIPLGWGVDSKGRATDDPKEVLNGGAMLPMGGAKGYAISLIVDILCSCLSGAQNGQELGSFYDFTRTQNTGYCFAAIDIGQVIDLDVFKGQVDSLFDSMKNCPRGEGISEIMIPGEIEYNKYEKAQKEGITLSEAVISDLKNTAEHYGVPFIE